MIKDLTRALQLSPSFDDMDKRSLLARIVKRYPAIQSLISGDQTRQEASLLVSWESLERRKTSITSWWRRRSPPTPKKSRWPALRRFEENHEYKAAKEMQKLLMRPKADLETQLVRARGSDFATPRTDVASIGTVVRSTDLATNQPALHHLVAWDSDPERDIVSYLSPVAQSLLDHKVGDQVEFEIKGEHHHHRLDSIQAYKTAPPGNAPGPEVTAG